MEFVWPILYVYSASNAFTNAKLFTISFILLLKSVDIKGVFCSGLLCCYVVECTLHGQIVHVHVILPHVSLPLINFKKFDFKEYQYVSLVCTVVSVFDVHTYRDILNAIRVKWLIKVSLKGRYLLTAGISNDTDHCLGTAVINAFSQS
jgi:hypothetical protein